MEWARATLDWWLALSKSRMQKYINTTTTTTTTTSQTKQL
jgi:hypothetical protein